MINDRSIKKATKQLIRAVKDGAPRGRRRAVQKLIGYGVSPQSFAGAMSPADLERLLAEMDPVVLKKSEAKRA